MTVETLASDAVIWATLLLIAIGGAACACIVVVWILGRSGTRFTPASARVAIGRIVRIALVVYVATFVGGMIVGLFQE